MEGYEGYEAGNMPGRGKLTLSDCIWAIMTMCLFGYMFYLIVLEIIGVKS